MFDSLTVYFNKNKQKMPKKVPRGGEASGFEG
jgi:hypothetical protein